MKVIRKSGQKNPINVNRVRGDYNIRTFTGNNPRNRSPYEKSTQNLKRSPNRIYGQGTSESALGEMFYLEPNETNYRRGQNMSPLNDSHNMVENSPSRSRILVLTFSAIYSMASGSISTPSSSALARRMAHLSSNFGSWRSKAPAQVRREANLSSTVLI